MADHPPPSSLAYVITLAALTVAIVGTTVRYRLYRIASSAMSRCLRSGSPLGVAQWTHYYWWCCTWDIVVTRLGWAAARIVLDSPVGTHVARALADGARTLLTHPSLTHPSLASLASSDGASWVASVFVSREGLCLLYLGIALVVERRRFELLIRQLLWNRADYRPEDDDAKRSHEWLVVRPLGFVPDGAWSSAPIKSKLSILHMKAAAVAADRPLFREPDLYPRRRSFSLGGASGRAIGEDALQALNRAAASGRATGEDALQAPDPSGTGSHPLGETEAWCSTCDFTASDSASGAWTPLPADESAEEAPHAVIGLPEQHEGGVKLQVRVYARPSAAAMDPFEARGHADFPSQAIPFLPQRSAVMAALATGNARQLDILWESQPVLSHRLLNTYMADSTAGTEGITLPPAGGAPVAAPRVVLEGEAVLDVPLHSTITEQSNPYAAPRLQRSVDAPPLPPPSWKFWKTCVKTPDVGEYAAPTQQSGASAPEERELAPERAGTLRVSIRRYRHAPLRMKQQLQMPPLPSPRCDELFRVVYRKYGSALERIVSAVNNFIFAGDPNDVLRELADAPLRTLSPRIWRVLQVIPRLDASNPQAVAGARLLTRVRDAIAGTVVAPLLYVLAPKAYHSSSTASRSTAASPADTASNTTASAAVSTTSHRDSAAEEILLGKTLRRWVIRKWISEKPYAITTAFFYTAIPLGVVLHISVMQFPLVPTALHLLTLALRLLLFVVLEFLTLFAPWHVGSIAFAKDARCKSAGDPAARKQPLRSIAESSDPVTSLLGVAEHEPPPKARAGAVFSTYEPQTRLRLLFYFHALQWIHTFDPLLLLITVTPLSAGIGTLHPTAGAMANDAISQALRSGGPTAFLRGIIALLVACGWPLLNGVAFATTTLRLLSGLYALAAPEAVLFKWLASI